MGPAGGVREPAVVRGTAAVPVMVGLAVVLAAVLPLAVVWARQRDNAPADDPGEPVRVGVVTGQSVGDYLGNSRAELAALTAPSAPVSGVTWALVSLDAYVPPARLPGLLAGAPVAQAYARLADAYTAGSGFEPDFDLAVTRHRLLDAFERSSNEGRVIQLAGTPVG